MRVLVISCVLIHTVHVHSQRWYLWDGADSVDVTDEFTVRLKKQEQLKVEFVQSLTQLQLLKRQNQKTPE